MNRLKQIAFRRESRSLVAKVAGRNQSLFL